MCTGICGATSLSFKGAMKAERFGLITSILTLNDLNFSASCDEGEEKKTWSPSNERLNHKSWEWERGKGEWEWDKKKKKKGGGITRVGSRSDLRTTVNHSLPFLTPRGSEESSVSFACLLFDVCAVWERRSFPAFRVLLCIQASKPWRELQ